jgi:hypothetical protein
MHVADRETSDMRLFRDVRMIVESHRVLWIVAVGLSLILAACSNGGQGPSY